MAKQAGSDGWRATPPMVLDERADPRPLIADDRPGIESDGHPGARNIRPNEEPPPDPRAVIEDLRQQLRAEQEKSLNSVDAVLGARAAAAQAKAEAQETFYRLHVRETELEQLKELLLGRSEATGDASAASRQSQTLRGPIGSVGGPGAPGLRAASEPATPGAVATTRRLLSSVKRMLSE